MSRNLLPLYIVLLSLGVVVIMVGGVDFDAYCSDPENTPCKTKCRPGSACGNDYEVLEMTDDDRNAVVQQHNQLRNAIATRTEPTDAKPPEAAPPAAADGGGGETPAPARRKRLKIAEMPECKTMKVMSYSKELEFLAECHIMSCEHEHDAVRKTSDGQSAGQNIAWKMSGSNTAPDDLLKSSINNWFSEYTNVSDAEVLTKFPGAKMGVGHFTAMIWGPTAYIGCAKLRVYDGSNHVYIFFCDYQPQGNIIGASFCATKDECPVHPPDFAGLCGEVRPLSDDPYVPPDIPDGAWRMGCRSIALYLIWTVALRIVR